MLDPDFVERIERNMAENGGELDPEDAREIWKKLCFLSRSNDMAELALWLVTDEPFTEALLFAREVAAAEHPNLDPYEAIECELRRIQAGESYG